MNMVSLVCTYEAIFMPDGMIGASVEKGLGVYPS